MYSPSRSPLPPPSLPDPLGLPSAPGPSTCLMHPTSLQYSCHENPMDKGNWRAAGSQGSKELDTYTHLLIYLFLAALGLRCRAGFL